MVAAQKVISKNTGLATSGKRRYAITVLVLALIPLFLWLSGSPDEFPLTAGYKCPFYELSGKPCMSCGMTRAAYAIGHGRLIEAAGYNLLIIPLALLWAYMLVYSLFCLILRKPPRHIIRFRILIMILLPAAVLYWIWRLFTGL